MSGGLYDGLTLNPVYGAGYTNTYGTAFVQKWPTPVRDYDAVSVTVNKLFSKRWLAQASYTWSSLRGNYGGLLRTDSDQLDPNLSSDYDLVGLQGNKTGPLGLNREHQLKLAGSYNASLSSDVSFVPSMNFQAYSGIPVNALAGNEYYGFSEVSLLPRGTPGNLGWTYQVDLGAKVIWAISGPYTLQFSLDIFNVLNMASVQWVDNDYTFDSASPIQNAQCSNKDSATAKNPIQALQADCSDLPFARTVDGRRVTVNPNYGQPQASSNARVSAYQLPISARFGVQLSF